jgi:hypothetical protein
MKLNEKQIIDLRKLRRKIKLNEKNKEEAATVIKCENYEDIIEAIHYLLSVLQRDLLFNDIASSVMDFEAIYKEAKRS